MLRPLALSILLFAASTAPAAAQAALVRSCTAFGEAQYRKLDPAFDRLLALESPPPALERFDARAGAQSLAAALTLHGRLSYRNRPALETQLVCLLDGADRPVFVYALPALAPAARTSPTPLGRAPAAPSFTMALPPRAAQRPAAGPPQRPAAAPAVRAIRLRGLVRDMGGRLQFQPCDGAPLTLEDRTPDRELTRTLQELTAGQEGRPMFVELYGGRDAGPSTVIGALEVRRAAVETAGCRERFDQREWVVTGNEPFWRLEITSRELMLSVMGGVAPLRVPHGGLQREGTQIVYAATEGPPMTVTIDERRCVDSMSGSLFAYAVEVRSDGRSFAGCAAHNPAMPAP